MLELSLSSCPSPLPLCVPNVQVEDRAQVRNTFTVATSRRDCPSSVISTLSLSTLSGPCTLSDGTAEYNVAHRF